MGINICHERVLNARELKLGLETLRSFLEPPGKKSSRGFAYSSAWDVASYFPRSLMGCSHCEKSQYADVFKVVISHSISMATSDPERRDLAERFSQLSDCDYDISWAAVIQCALMDFKLEDMIVIGKFFLHGIAPSRVTSAFNLSTVETTSLLFQKSLDWRNFVDTEDHKFISKRREPIENLLRSSPQDLVANKNSYQGRYLQLVSQKVIDSKDSQIQEEWFRSLISNGDLRSREIERLVDSYAKRREKLPEELVDLVWGLLINQDKYGGYVILNLYKYAKLVPDYELGDRLVSHVLESPKNFSQIATHSTVIYALEERRYEALNLIAQNEAFLNRIDFTTFDLITNRVSAKIKSNTLLKAILKAARKFPSESDFMILLSSYISITAEISERKIGEIVEAAKGYFESHQTRDVSFHSRTIAEDELMLRTLVSHPEIFREIFPIIRKALPKRAQMIQRLGDVLTDSSSSDVDVLNAAFEQGFYALNANSIAVLAITSTPNLLPKLNAAIKILEFSLSKSLKVPEVVIEKLFKYVAYELDFEDSRKVFDGLLLIEPLTLRTELLNRIAYELFVDNRRKNSALALVRSLEGLGITVQKHVWQVALDASITSGEHYEWGLVDGPEAEYWSQLAVIFDDVVHELNQPLLAVGFWIEYLKLLETGAPGDRALGITGIENAKNELASRMIHYQALTKGGTDPMWYRADELIEQVLKDLANQLEGSRVKVKIETSYLKEGKWIYAPGFQFRLAIRNIVRNAITALEVVQGEREIQISIKNPFRTSSQLVIMIEDNGPGIPEELQENIFKKGFTTKEGRGLGLGLPLAATVVRGMGGTLKLQATSLHGSTFVIVLPSSESPVEDLFRGDGSNMISRSYDGDEDSDVPDK